MHSWIPVAYLVTRRVLLFYFTFFVAFQYKEQPKDKATPGFCADEEWQNISPGIASLVIVLRLLVDLWLVAND